MYEEWKKLSPEEQVETCPVTKVNSLISGKWKIIILWHLGIKSKRFSELNRLLPSASKGVLTRQLRELEEDQLITRKVFQEVPPKVVYSLSPLGEKFFPILEEMGNWSKNHLG